jgi:hypothetical protein
MDDSRTGRFQFSIRSLLLMTAAVAILLVPVVWVARERRQMVLAQTEILAAREVALRSIVHEQALRQRRPSAHANQPLRWEAVSLDDLKRENAELKRQVKELHRELELLRSSAEPAGAPGR